MKKNSLLFISILLAGSLFAQKNPENLYSLSNSYKLRLQELLTPPKYETNWRFGTSCICKGTLVTIVSCLSNTEYGRIKVKGDVPNKHLDVELSEPSRSSLQEMLSNPHQNPKSSSGVDSFSVVGNLLAILSRTYHFSIRDTVEHLEVWYLKVANAAKLPRYQGADDNNERGGFFDNTKQAWFATGIELRSMCIWVKDHFKSIVYDATEETGSFDYEFPVTETVDKLSDYLVKNYGLILEKRRQAEAIKIIEFH